MNVQEIAISELIPYEKNPRNNLLAVDAAIERWETFTGEKAVLLNEASD